MRRWAVGLLAATLAASSAFAQEEKELEPRAYLNAALDALESKHINRSKVDWAVLRKEAQRKAKQAKTAADTYPAIDYVIEALGERHTLLYAAPSKSSPASQGAMLAPTVYPLPKVEGELIDGRFGYLRIPSFGANADHPDADLYVAMSRRILQRHERAGVCGWVIDLRGNGGGNIWPMVDGLLPLLSPLIGKGPYWSFETDGKRTDVSLAKGRLVGEFIPERPAFEYREVNNATAPIAVLIDGRTGSSGEGVAYLFKSLPNARFFGATTADLITVNNPVRLADGAVIQMTVGYSRMRDGTPIRGPVQPDEVTTTEAARDAAIAWLSRQPCVKTKTP